MGVRGVGSGNWVGRRGAVFVGGWSLAAESNIRLPGAVAAVKRQAPSGAGHQGVGSRSRQTRASIIPHRCTSPGVPGRQAPFSGWSPGRRISEPADQGQHHPPQVHVAGRTRQAGTVQRLVTRASDLGAGRPGPASSPTGARRRAYPAGRHRSAAGHQGVGSRSRQTRASIIPHRWTSSGVPGRQAPFIIWSLGRRIIGFFRSGPASSRLGIIFHYHHHPSLSSSSFIIFIFYIIVYVHHIHPLQVHGAGRTRQAGTVQRLVTRASDLGAGRPGPASSPTGARRRAYPAGRHRSAAGHQGGGSRSRQTRASIIPHRCTSPGYPAGTVRELVTRSSDRGAGRPGPASSPTGARRRAYPAGRHRSAAGHQGVGSRSRQTRASIIPHRCTSPGVPGRRAPFSSWSPGRRISEPADQGQHHPPQVHGAGRTRQAGTVQQLVTRASDLGAGHSDHTCSIWSNPSLSLTAATRRNCGGASGEVSHSSRLVMTSGPGETAMLFRCVVPGVSREYWTITSSIRSRSSVGMLHVSSFPRVAGIRYSWHHRCHFSSGTENAAAASASDE